jgi:hypothetical protein
MNCNDAKKRIPALALDDIDVEERREAEKHLEGCAACRAERDGLTKVHGAMKALPEVETSQARRDAVVGAMTAARADILEKAMIQPPKRNWGWIAAAAVVLAAASWFALAPIGPTYRIVSGTGIIITVDGTVPIAVGSIVRRGDRIVAEQRVRIEGANAVVDIAGELSIHPDELLLERGTMDVDVRKGELVVTDISRDRLVLRTGKFQLQLFRAEGKVSSDPSVPVKTESSLRLAGSVLEGSARLVGENGQLELKQGETGKLDPRGYPYLKKE